jgi:outer membrane protein
MKIYQLLLVLYCCLYASQISAQQNIQIGILTDIKDKTAISPFLDILKNEIQRTIGSDYTIKIADKDIINGITTSLESKESYQQLEKRNLNFILIFGPKSLTGIAKKKAFIVPTIAVGILDGQLQGLPKTAEGTTGKENFTYIQSSTPLREAVCKFKKLSNFKNLSLLADSDLISIFDEELARQDLKKMEKELSIKIEAKLISSKNIDQLTFSDSTEAAFLLLDFQVSADDLSKIVQQLNEQKIPSFSSVQEHVNNGILFSYGDDRSQILRKIALSIDETLEGFSMANMPVDIDVNQKLYVNISTVQTIQFPLNYQTVFTSNIVKSKIELPKYELLELLEKSLNENLMIKISQKDILNSELDIKQAISNYYPDLDLSATYTELSKNQANELLGQSQRSVAGNLSFSQVIFSENILANIKMSEYLLEAQKHNTEQDVLNVIFDTYSAYFSILQNQASMDIQRENLEVSKTNLELAKLKKSLGLADNSDVYRLEGELATNTQNLIQAQANIILSKLNLNQILNYTLPNEYEVANSNLESDIFQKYKNHSITNYIQSPMQMRRLIDFLVLEAEQKNPSKNELAANQKLLERQLKLNERVFYTPTISANGSANSTLLRGGEGSTSSTGIEYVDNTWNLGVSLSYPIFDGTRRRLNKQQTKVSLEQMRLNIENFDQNIRLALQSNLLSLFTAYTDLDYSKRSLDNQEKSFELNQNKYRVGQISIVQLLDGQNALVQAKQTYVLSIYNFIQMFLELEYNIGYFSQLTNPVTVQDFEIRLQEFLKKN